ncbi:hypothetical protein D3C78_404020 [compost metagenome]
MNAVHLCSGFGGTHTNEPDPSKPKKLLKPYAALTLEQIRALVNAPQQVDKAKAQWLIPSTLASRNFARQEQDGEFWLLWADLDTAPPPLDDLELALTLGPCLAADYEIYTSRSATQERPKSRILIPLSKPLRGADWVLCQRALNDYLADVGYTPDRASERAAQLCYLPNRGEYYDTRSSRGGLFLDALEAFGPAIERMREEQRRRAVELEQQRTKRKARREALTLADTPDTISAFNLAYSVQEILLEAGYSQHGDRFCHPASESGSYSANIKNGRVHSLSSSDPLYTGGHGGGAHDAFSAFTILFHEGDQKAALRDAGDNRLFIGGEPWNSVKRREYVERHHETDLLAMLEDLPPEELEQTGAGLINSLFGPDTAQPVKIPEALRGTVVGQLAQRVSHCLEFPEASVFLALLGTASAAVATAYAVQYVTGTSIPAGLYCVIEQPPATQKSYLLEVGLAPYMCTTIAHNSAVKAHNAQKDMKEDHLPLGFTNATDATSAGLDMMLAGRDSGRFVIASAEQSAFASLFPKDGSYSSNNELVLKGHSGEFVASARKGRDAFNGVASGTIVLIAQPGSAKRVFSASEGSGLAERFLYLNEPSLLGRRKLHGEYLSHGDRQRFEHACAECVAEYSTRMLTTSAGNRPAIDPVGLIQLRASPEGYTLIREQRRQMEPWLGKLAKRGELVLLSWLGKIEAHTLKVATVLHVIECRAADSTVPELIPTHLIRAALELVAVLGDHLQHILQENGENGDAAEVEAVYALVSEKHLTLKAATMALKNRAPFKAMGKAAYKSAGQRLAAMREAGLLILSAKGELRAV